MDTAEKLISRFRPVLAAGVAPVVPAERVVSDDADQLHAEVLHQLCTADGLLELLDWTRQGLGADPLACMWLGSLRWYRLLAGACPVNAPQPPARPLDAELQRLILAGSLPVRPGSAAGSLRGLADGAMAYPSSPAQPESRETAALLRVVPVGLVPYIEAPMRRSWARQTVALTHGHPELLGKAEALADLVHELASGPASTELPETAAAQRQLITADVDDEVAVILERQIAAAAGLDGPADEPERAVLGVIDDLARSWEDVTRAR